MESEIEKLKTDYDLKIKSCDILISHMSDSIRQYRGKANVSIVALFRKDRAIEQARRQAYVQAKYDFDSLLDYI